MQSGERGQSRTCNPVLKVGRKNKMRWTPMRRAGEPQWGEGGGFRVREAGMRREASRAFSGDRDIADAKKSCRVRKGDVNCWPEKALQILKMKTTMKTHLPTGWLVGHERGALVLRKAMTPTL